MDSERSNISLELVDITGAQVLALAQFVKRLHFDDLESHAVNEEEAYRMRDAIEKLQDALAVSGYAPR